MGTIKRDSLALASRSLTMTSSNSSTSLPFQLKKIANAFSPAFGLHVGIHLGSLVAGTVGQKTLQFDILGKDVNIAFNICDISDDNQALLSSEAWMSVRKEVSAKSIGLKRLKSGQEMELFECHFEG